MFPQCSQFPIRETLFPVSVFVSKMQIISTLNGRRGRRGGLRVSALDSGASGPGSSPGRGQCVVFLGKTL